MKVVSSAIADRVLKSIIASTQQKISQKQFVKNHMSLYSSQRMISLVNQLGDQLLTLPHELQHLQHEIEPVNLAGDTLMSLTNLQPVQQSSLQGEKAQTISDHKSTSRSNNKQAKNHIPKNILGMENDDNPEKKEQSDPNLQKLKLGDDKEDSDITEIRKQKEKLVLEQKQLEKRRNEKNKQVKLSKDGVNYDYNGSLIQIKPDKKYNLISKLVTPKIPNEQIDRKKNEKPVKQNGTFLKTYQIKEGQESKEGKSKKPPKYREAEIIKQQEKLDVLFSKIKNPIQIIEVKEGVKATFNQNILQKQRKKLTNQELIQSRSHRKLSKNEYARIKTSTLRSKPQPVEDPNTQEAEEIEPVVNVKLRPQVSKSYSTNLKKRALTQSEGQKIRVEDISLKKQLIEKVKEVDSVQDVRKVLDDRPLSQAKKKEQLSKIDQYNLNYSRNKTQYSAMKKISDNESILPKIHNKTQISYPKLREKIKEASSMRREVMKKFEQTLRV